jgi:hypothetical protein
MLGFEVQVSTSSVQAEALVIWTVRSASLPISGDYFHLGNKTYDENLLTF